MNIDRIGIKGKNDNDFVMIDKVYGLYPLWRSLSMPEPVTNYVTIPGMNGVLDCSEEFGEVFYNQRELNADCICIDDNWHEVISRFASKYHGQTVQILFANDPAYYWAGRISMNVYESEDRKLTMSVNVYPFKFKRNRTVVSLTDNRSRIITLRNGRMPVIPEITITAPVTLAWDDESQSIASSSYPATVVLPGLRLTEGTKAVTVIPQSSSFTISFAYREGDL
jgi:hypothetical protein